MKGVTLIEVLVTSLILAIVGTGLASYLIISTRLNNIAVSSAMATNISNLTLSTITSSVRNGSSVTVSSTDSTTFTVNYSTTSPSHKIFKYTESDSSLTCGPTSDNMKKINIGNSKIICHFKPLPTNPTQAVRAKVKVICNTGQQESTSGFIISRIFCRNNLQ